MLKQFDWGFVPLQAQLSHKFCMRPRHPRVLACKYSQEASEDLESGLG